MSGERVIRKITREQQEAETYSYWQSLSAGERLSAVWDATVAAYAMKGIRVEDMPRSRSIKRGERTPKGDQ
jgi:hypothetical protein